MRPLRNSLRPLRLNTYGMQDVFNRKGRKELRKGRKDTKQQTFFYNLRASASPCEILFNTNQSHPRVIKAQF